MRAGRCTKIVATLGPVSNSPEVIERLLEAGVNVFRLNFSHGAQEVHRATVDTIRSTADAQGVSVGILQDLQGPKIRVARFKDDHITLVPGQKFTLTCGDSSPGDGTRVGVTYTNLVNDLKIGDTLLLDDGRLELRVTGLQDDDIHTEVVVGGVLSNNKGINIPGAHLSIPALTDKDVEDLRFGAELDVDWVAMSFVRTRDDLLLARHYLARAGSQARLMAKIEKPSAVERFSEILQEVDGIMVARGDLGVEMPAERVPLIQKQLIRECMQAGKPVITATQMLESMITNSTPTRAEASDVANAIFDGTDAVMLSAETAVGAYPVEAVRMMDRIARAVEASPEYRDAMHQLVPTADASTADAVALAAVEMAYNLDARLIVTFTSSGNTALRVSRNRPPTPVLAITPNPRALRQMMVAWSVVPYLSDDIHNTDEMVVVAKRGIEATKLIGRDDRFIITAGVPFGMRGTTNLIRVERNR
ncbi:MAG: pyruvate kinase [Trueperaceae bacterium]|nr:pyruvate kinase [Trueperaceae bacterium]